MKLFRKSCRPAQGNQNCCVVFVDDILWHRKMTDRSQSINTFNTGNVNCFWNHLLFSFEIVDQKMQKKSTFAYVLTKDKWCGWEKIPLPQYLGVIHQNRYGDTFSVLKDLGAQPPTIIQSRFENPPFRFKLIYRFISLAVKFLSYHLAVKLKLFCN